ncbi:MAG TPA: hypothetical protein VNO50_11920 [Pyrinomonadaceae bacterium]|nr:hypothetical protein [Pyrinomonadaceae bacterium]
MSIDDKDGDHSENDVEEAWLKELLPAHGLPSLSESRVDETQELMSAPSALLWLQELQLIVAGERASKILRLGEASQFVRVIIDSSSERILARRTLNEALAEFLQEWRPSLADDNYAQESILSLITAFQPAIGFIRLSNYMREGGRFNNNYQSLAAYGPTDLQLMALTALRAFYPAPPPSTHEPGFQTYVGILRQHATNPEYAGYAVTELLKLEIFKTQDREILESIAESPISLERILPYLLTPARRAYAPEDLRNVFAHCIEIGSWALESFESIVGNQGGSVDYVAEIDFALKKRYSQSSILVPVISMKDRSTYPILLTREEIEAYTQHRYGSLQQYPIAQFLHDPLISRSALGKELTLRLEQRLKAPDFRSNISAAGDFEAQLERNGARLAISNDKICVRLQHNANILLEGLSKKALNCYLQILMYRKYEKFLKPEPRQVNPREQVDEILARAKLAFISASQK